MQVQTELIANSAITAAKLATDAVETADILDGSVTTPKLANNAVTPNKMSQPLTHSTAQNTTSGTVITFGSIPSWVRRITMSMNGVSLSGTSNPRIRLGTGGAAVTSGYTGTTAAHVTGTTVSALSAGFDVQSSFAAGTNTFSGVVVMVNVSGNIWALSTYLAVGGGLGTAGIAGVVTLSGTLDSVFLTSVNGTDTFDAGSVNLHYE